MNDRIRQVNASFGRGDHEIFFCECDRPGCIERVEVPAEVYDVIRGDLKRFLVAPGHEPVSDEEMVVAGAPGYLVVAMRPEAV